MNLKQPPTGPLARIGGVKKWGWRAGREDLLVLATLVVYVAMFFAVQPRIGQMGGSFLALGPVVLAAGRRGMWAGVVTALVAYAMTTVLFGIASGGPPTLGAGGGAGLPALVLVGAAMGFLRDFYRRARSAEEQARLVAAQLAEAQAIAHLGSWDWNIAADHVSVSAELRRILGLGPGYAANYQAFIEQIHPADPRRVDDEVRAAVEERRTFELEHRWVRPDGETRVVQARGRVVTDQLGRPSRLVGTSQDITEEAHRRASREALVRVARRLAGETDVSRVMDALLDEAMLVLEADAGWVSRWSSDDELLIPVRVHAPAVAEHPPLHLGEGGAGLAAARREAVVLNDYGASGAGVAGEQVGVRAMVAAPLLYDGRLLGTVAVGALDRAGRWTAEDAEVLELLSALAAATLVGLERSRLDGILLLARTAEHEVNNRLALKVGYLDLLASSPELPASLRELGETALAGAQGVADVVQGLRNIIRVEEVDWGAIGETRISTIDLARSGGDR